MYANMPQLLHACTCRNVIHWPGCVPAHRHKHKISFSLLFRHHVYCQNSDLTAHIYSSKEKTSNLTSSTWPRAFHHPQIHTLKLNIHASKLHLHEHVHIVHDRKKNIC